VYIGTYLLKAKLNPGTDPNVVTANLNILGMDFLDLAVPELIPWLSDRLSQVQKEEPIWVQQCDASNSPIGSAFKVSPTSSDVDGLKKAIKAELGPKYPSLVVPDIKIFVPGTTAHAKASLPLTESSEEKPYLFELQKQK